MQSKGIDLDISMTHVCIHESTKQNMSKPSENANHPPGFVVSSICLNWSALVTSSKSPSYISIGIFF